MKNIFTSFFFLFLLLIASHSFSQAPNWLWAAGATGGSCYTEGHFIAVSPSTGNVFFSGRFGGTLTLGGKTVACLGSTQSISGKINASGNASWMVSHNFPGTGNDYNYSFTIDDSDNSIVGGILNSGSGGGYIDKYDSAGNFMWSSLFGPASPYGIATDKAGNVYVTGDLNGTATFGTKSVSTIGGSDVFLVKYNNAGVCQWAKNYGGPGTDGGRGVAVDQGGNIYIEGSYNGPASFGSIAPAAAGAYPNFFIAKFDTVGNPLWVNPATNAGFGTSYQFWNYNGMALDSCGNVYVSGHFVNTAQFGNLPSVTSAGGRDIFVAKCLNSGSWEWVKSAGGPSDDDAIGLAIDRKNDVYITGTIQGTGQFGNLSVSSSGSYNIYIAKYANSNGDLQWVQTGDGTGTSGGSGVTVDRQGYVYAISSLNGSQTFGPSSVSSSSNGCGSPSTIFIVKLDTTPSLNIIPHADPSYCAGSTTNLPFDITGIFNGSNTFTAELSDSSGSFVSPDTLGSFSSISGGQIKITIPGNVAPGTKYVIRIVSSNPATSSHYYCNSFSTSTIQTTYATVTISNGSKLIVIPDTTISSGNSYNLSVSGGNNYTWTPSTGLSCTNCFNPVASPTSSQTYMVTANAGSACAGSASIVINVLPPVNLITNPAGDTTICGGKSVQLSVSGASTYVWSSSPTITCTSCTSNLVTPTADTTAYIVTGTSADGKCSAFKQLNVYLGNSAIGGEIISPRDTICQGTSTKLTLANYLGSPVQWQSSTNDTNFRDISTIDTSNYKTDPLSQTIWYRAIIGTGTCVATSDTLKLFVPPTLISKFDYTASNKVVTFNSDSSSGSIRTYSWNFGDNSPSSNEANPVHTFPQDTTYYVCLTLYDGSNCSYTFCRYISSLTGVNTVSATGNLNIYPNPVSDQLIISSTGLMKDVNGIEMIDMLGRVVKNWNSSMLNNNPITLNVSGLSKGMYYLKIHTNQADYIQKVVKE